MTKTFCTVDTLLLNVAIHEEKQIRTHYSKTNVTSIGLYESVFQKFILGIL
jgi:hypothetical protein